MNCDKSRLLLTRNWSHFTRLKETAILCSQGCMRSEKHCISLTKPSLLSLFFM